MEFVNKYISIVLARHDGIIESACFVNTDEHHLYLSYQLADIDSIFDIDKELNYFELRIDKAFFEKYDFALELAAEKQSMCCSIQSKLVELANCKLVGLTRSLFLESVILHLVYQANKNQTFGHSTCSKAFANSPDEHEKVQRVKEFIHSNLELSLTIPYLSSIAGTNECYLKKTFKESTGQTVFDYIQESRMLKAKHLLRNVDISVQEVAHTVGYASVSSFSQSYKNYFGIVPSKEQKEVQLN